MDATLQEMDAAASSLFADLLDPQRRHDPYPTYAELREHGAVIDTGLGIAMVTHHAEVRAVLRDPGFSSDESRSAINQMRAEAGTGADFLDELRLLLFMDPPDHTRIRGLVARAFTPRRIADLRPNIEVGAAELLGARRDHETIDVVADYAFPLATRVICDLLGVPREDREVFGEWSSEVSYAVDPRALRSDEIEARIERSGRALMAYFGDVLEDRRRHPADDLLSALIAAQDDDDRLDDEELLHLCVLLLLAGHETTVNLIANSVHALLDRPATLERLAADPGLDATAIDEFLRFDSPVQVSQRIATHDVEVGGVPLAAGTTLILLLGAANRDPLAFPDPDELLLHRDAQLHVAFGGGIHHCLGAALARSEAEVALRSLLDHTDGIERAGDAPRKPTFTLRGLDRLPVRVDWR